MEFSVPYSSSSPLESESESASLAARLGGEAESSSQKALEKYSFLATGSGLIYKKNC